MTGVAVAVIVWNPVFEGTDSQVPFITSVAVAQNVPLGTPFPELLKAKSKLLLVVLAAVAGTYTVAPA